MILSKSRCKRLIQCILLALVLLMTAMHVSAETSKTVSGKTYYISSSTGDDGNDGLSEKSAWKSLAKIAEITLGAGDQVLLKSGDEWLGEHVVVNAPSGTAESPVVLGAYGEGEKPKLALFENEVPKYQETPLLLVKNAEHFVIDGLDIGFCGVGIDLYYEIETNKENVRIQNCHFHDIYGFHQVDKKNITKYPHATAIVVTANVPIPGCSDPVLKGLYIDKCTSYDAGALYTYGSRIGSAGYNVKGLYVTDCVMENNGIYGIAVCGMDGGYMDNCKIVDCGSRYAPMGSMGIMVSGEDFTIMNSEISFQQRFEDNPDGGGIDFEHMTYDTDIINCYIHDNSGVGVMMFSSGGDTSHQNRRIRFIGNVFENNNQNVGNVGGAEIISIPMYSLVHGAIYNNRYMESDNLFTMSMDGSVDVKGNIAYGEENQGKVWPVYDFDDVRAYVIDGTPLPSLENEPTSEEVMYDWIYDYGNYFLGIAIGLIVIVLLSVTALLVGKKKKVSTGMLLLVVCLMSSLMLGTTSEASGEGPYKTNGTEKDGVYRLSKMYSEEMGMWQYYWFDGTSSYTKMSYNEKTAAHNGGSPATSAIIGGADWHTYISGYTVATFTCPKSGTVRIGMEEPVALEDAASSADGTILAVMSDGKLVGVPVQVTKEKPTSEYRAVEMDVYEGQVIGFYLHMNTTNAGDSTRVTPFVEYTDYKEVARTETKEEEKKVNEPEKVLRTDIAPINIEEEEVFVLNPVQLLGSSIPVVVAGALILIIVMKKGNKKNE